LETEQEKDDKLLEWKKHGKEVDLLFNVLKSIIEKFQAALKIN
jgi:hypothetical protein